MLSNLYFLANFVLIQPRTSPPKICKIRKFFLPIFPILLTSEVSLVPPLGDPDGAVDAWYAELADYDFGRPGPASATASFTQLVWKEAKFFLPRRILSYWLEWVFV